MKILHRDAGAVLFEVAAPTIRETVEAAVKARAYLGGAYLGGAYLARANLGGADLGGADLGSLFIAARATRSDGHEFFLWSSVLGGGVIRAGCRTFSLAQFREHVATTYPGTPTATETSAILDYLESRLPAARQRKAVELGVTL